ncbi:Glutamate decarboxylase [Methanimicrococcus sp. At1]|uniref:Probable L-tyrosine/L-aspartate decarboxylase n=1 Tax=Methanimicrococcus hacksteinii TaxID=3028293 RepID=A0ABU3VQ72_9EURY|nr:tyrosine decarboxylase MfnA [Methanimicrococcus sp. At1]MDV0445464.1 Glutamate decarboxylase [Methanimicrococcus sp. At1]
MDEKGISEEELFAELCSFSDADTNFKKVFSSMCTIPHPVAVAAQQQFSLSNIGDPGLFRGTCEMEAEVIRMSASMLNHPDPKSAFGHLTSGGTESNIEAVLHMKNRFFSSGFNSGFNSDSDSDSNSGFNSDSNSNSDFNSNSFQSRLNLILPKTAHFSFEKIANLLGIELKKAEIDSNFRVIPESMESLINENTIGLIGIAGSTEFGECDPIEELSEIAVKHKLPLHIDAAFGGFIYPFLDSCSNSDIHSNIHGDAHSNHRSNVRFAFDLPGVTSVSVDPHKMGLSVIPAGILIFRDESVLGSSLDKIKVKTPYLTSKYQSTLTGTRPGSSVAAAYAVMKHLGAEGYRKNVSYCMDLVNHFQKELEKIGLKPCIFPRINIVAVSIGSGINETADYEKTEKIRAQLLEKYGWNVSATKTIPALRFVLMPHVTKEDISALIFDLGKLLQETD